METDRRRAVYHCQVCGALAGELHADGCEENFPPARSAIGAGPVFAADQCPECRCAPDAPHNQDCPQVSAADGQVHIPLPLQERLFTLEQKAAFGTLYELLNYSSNELRTLALARLRSGFEQYGSTMFEWDEETRRRNVMEELADALVYLCSGPIGD